MNRIVASALVTALFLAPAARAAELLTNGGFETQSNFNPSAGAGYDGGYAGLVTGQLPGWTLLANHAVTAHINPGPYLTISGSYSMNLDGEGYLGHNADFYQDFGSVNGAGYTLSYDHIGWNIGNQAVQAKVLLTDLATNNVLYSNLFGWTAPLVNESSTFIGTGNTLRLHVYEIESGYNDNALIVDNFSVRGQAVPLPAATLAAVPLLSLLAATRLRRPRPATATA